MQGSLLRDPSDAGDWASYSTEESIQSSFSTFSYCDVSTVCESSVGVGIVGLVSTLVGKALSLMGFEGPELLPKVLSLLKLPVLPKLSALTKLDMLSKLPVLEKEPLKSGLGMSP